MSYLGEAYNAAAAVIVAWPSWPLFFMLGTPSSLATGAAVAGSSAQKQRK
ncbi:MAG: hypothetical protein ACRD1O_11635 [Terriglobia bacterium]